MVWHRLLLIAASALCAWLAANHFTAGQPANGNPGNPGWDYAPHPYLRDADTSRRQGESTLNYATRMSSLVHESTWHCPTYERGFSYIEGFLFAFAERNLFVHGVLIRERFHCGVCSQRAYMLKEILADRGIRSEVYFRNHVVLRVGNVLFDPDFGVAPFHLSDVPAAYSGLRNWDRYGFHEDLPGFFRWAFEANPSDAEIARWNRIMEHREAVQRHYFFAASAIAWALIALSVSLLLFAIKRSPQPSRTSIARNVRAAITSIDVSPLFWKKHSK